MMPFIPQIWEASGCPTMLVCGHRQVHGHEIKRPLGSSASNEPPQYEFLAHPVAIQLKPSVGLIFGFEERTERVWDVICADPATRKFPERLGGMSRQCAVLALEQAWRCTGQFTLDPFSFSLRTPLDPAKAVTFRDGAILRNVIIWTHWDSWNQSGLSKQQRIDILVAGGFKCTGKAFERVLDDAGVSC